jgi:hypothetical protein
MKITKFKARIPLGDEKKKYFVNVVFSSGWGLFGQTFKNSPDYLIDLLSFDVDPGYIDEHPEKNVGARMLVSMIDDRQDLWQICND